MGDSGITVTYSGSDVLLDSTSFSHLLATFSHQLPLRNLHWKPSASYTSSSAPVSPFYSSLPHPTSIRTIQSLGVQLEPIADTILRTKLKPETRHLIQRTLLERPFCHLYFVVCDDSDTYRTSIRNDIRSWLSTVQSNSTLSAATVTAKGFQGIESLHMHKNGSTSSINNGSTIPRAGTPDVRPATPSKDEDGGGITSPTPTTSKDKLPPPSPEYLIVVISAPDGSPLPLSTPAGRGPPAPRANRPSSSQLSTEFGEKPTIAPAKSGPVRFFSSSNSSKGAVIDKVKADFNTSRRERVVHLTRLPPLNKTDKPTLTGQSDPTIFADLQTRLKECVSATFDAVVEMQGEVVKREGQKRNVPGWNFCKWMAGMECVASTFEGVGLFSDALAQYEEIEAAFLQCLQDRNLPFFPHVGGTLQGDDSAPLLDISKKNYRELILRNEISLFDFRNYVFAKRAILLGKLGRVSQVMNETPIFLSRVAAMLQGESLPRHFLESWTFSCSIDVVEQCQAWLVASGDASAPGHHDVEDSDNPSNRSILSNAAFHSAKAELLDLARRQLDKIGIAVGHLPNAVPFTLSQSHGLDRKLPPLPGGKEAQPRISNDVQISRQELLSAIESRELFDLHYVSLTERVLTSWTSGGRQRNVLRLRCVLGSLHFFRQRYSQAYVKFTVLPEPYAEGSWSLIEASHLAKQLECHAQLGKPYDRAWASVVIALLETLTRSVSIPDDSKDKMHDISLRWLDSSFLYSQLREYTQSFSQEIPISRFAPIQIQVKDQVAHIASSGNQDGTEITVTVKNDSNCSIEVDDIRVCAVNGAGKEMWFTSGKTELSAGEITMTLSCFLFSQPGKYVVDVSQIRLSKVIVQYLHRKQKDISRNSTFVDVLEDGDALQVDLELSKEVWLDRCRSCTMNIWTGRNEMEKLAIRLYDKNNREFVKGFLEATLERDFDDDAKPVASLAIDENEYQVVLKDLPLQSVIKLTIPLLDFQGAADSTMSFLAELDYWDIKQPLRKRQIRTELRLSIGLPLGVNVQDFFRSDKLFSKFLISAGSGGFLRLGKVYLECEGMEAKEDGPFEIATSMQKNDTIVTHFQTASYLFSIRRRQNGQVGPVNRNLRLTISYRTLHEEAVQILLDQLDQVLSRGKKQVSQAHKRNLQRALSSFAMNQTETSTYLSKGRLQFVPWSELQWRHLYRQWAGMQNKEQENHIASIVQETLFEAQNKNLTVDESKSKWQQLSLIVDVPRMNIVNAVTVNLEDPDQIVRIGQVIKARINIETTFHWDDEMYHEVIKPPAPSLLTSGHFKEKCKEEEEDDDAASFQNAKSRASTPTQSDGTITSAHSEKEDKNTMDESNVYYLSVDVNCDFVNWLLIGLKRTVIKVARPEYSSSLGTTTAISNHIEFSLVAIKSGDLLFPSVTIWPTPDPIQITPPSHAHRDKESNAKLFEEESKRMRKMESITCDSYITNEAKIVKVLSNLQGGQERRTYWMNI